MIPLLATTAFAIAGVGLLVAAQSVPVTVVSQEVFLTQTIIAVTADGRLSSSSVPLTFSNEQRCRNWKAMNGFLDFGVRLDDRVTAGVPAIHLIAVTSECAAK